MQTLAFESAQATTTSRRPAALKDWIFEQAYADCGVIRHRAEPRFSAIWASGADGDDLFADNKPCWVDPANSNEDDRLRLFGLQWHDREPDAETQQRLFKAAALAIDAWIADRL